MKTRSRPFLFASFRLLPVALNRPLLIEEPEHDLTFDSVEPGAHLPPVVHQLERPPQEDRGDSLRARRPSLGQGG